MAKSTERQCPRCKTWNPRANPNCAQCGAVMLGVDSADIADILARNAQDRAAPRAGETTPNRARTQRSAGDKPAGGCGGCLLRLGFLALLISISLTFFLKEELENYQSFDIERIADRVAHDLSRRFQGSPGPDPVSPPPAVARPQPTAAADLADAVTQDIASDPLARALIDPADAKEDELPLAPPAVQRALRAHLRALLRCTMRNPAWTATHPPTTVVVLSIDVQDGRIAQLPEVLEPQPAPGWTPCWQTIVQGLHLPEDTPAGHYRLPVSLVFQP